MSARGPWARLREAVLHAEGSTRPAALARIALALVVWTRFAPSLTLFRNRAWEWSLATLLVFTASTMLLIGYRTRLAALATALSLLGMVVLAGVIGGNRDFLHHHVSLLTISIGLLAATGSGRSFSVDRWRALQRAEAAGAPAPRELAPRWGDWLIALQVSAVYFWGAIDKTQPAFLSGERMEHILIYYYLGSDAPEAWWFPPLMQALAIATVIFEYTLAIGLWLPRWRRWLWPLGILFHAVIYLTMPVWTFTVTMFALYAFFLPPAAVHAVVDRLVGAGSAAGRPAGPTSPG